MLFNARRLVQGWGILAITALSASAQVADRPLAAPDGISLQFKTEGDLHQYHLGEFIPVAYSYTARVPGYLYVVNSKRLSGGQSIEVSCSPPVENTRRQRQTGQYYEAFEKMLVAGCDGVGMGGGVGGGCGDCDG
jgi:hypothetical protein